MQPIVEIRNLSTPYQLGPAIRHVDNLREVLHRTFSRSLWTWRGQRSAANDDQFWALRDVSFDVADGEWGGIIGQTGASKSTLLKIISRITDSTDGYIKLGGRVSSLLEEGTGFHPELTGRENIFLNGALLGMSRSEILSSFDEIVTFSEIEKFLDTAIKHYSSGMYVRLAFALAAHLSPDILIADEVLAGGDMAFQKKCLGKMGEVSQAGRTVLFVSHDMAAVEKLCQRGIVPHQRQVLFQGNSKEAIEHYLHNVWGEQDGRRLANRAGGSKEPAFPRDAFAKGWSFHQRRPVYHWRVADRSRPSDSRALHAGQGGEQLRRGTRLRQLVWTTSINSPQPVRAQSPGGRIPWSTGIRV